MDKEELEKFEFDMYKHRLNGFKLPTENEYRIMNITSKSLKDIPKQVKSDNNTKIDNAIEQGILSMSIFSKSYINKLKNVVFLTYNDLTENSFNTLIDMHNQKLYVKEIMIPKKINDVAPIWIGHECIHSLKDINYNEYIEKDIASEVIPLFYEILVSKTIFKDLHDIWKYERMNTLLEDKKYYEIGKNNIDDKEDRNTYSYIMDSYGQYLTSYYYALNLFSLYKRNPKVVAKYINKVLKHKKTTLELLKELNIYKINKKHVNTYILEHKNL